MARRYVLSIVFNLLEKSVTKRKEMVAALKFKFIIIESSKLKVFMEYMGFSLEVC